MPRKHLKNGKFGPVETFLIRRSGLTELQVVVARAFVERRYQVSKGGKHTKYRIGEETKGVSKGAFFRVLDQAKTNVERALYTIMLLSFYEMIDERAVGNIIMSGSLLKEATQGGSQITEEKLREALRSVEENIATEIDNTFAKQ